MPHPRAQHQRGPGNVARGCGQGDRVTLQEHDLTPPRLHQRRPDHPRPRPEVQHAPRTAARASKPDRRLDQQSGRRIEPPAREHSRMEEPVARPRPPVDRRAHLPRVQPVATGRRTGSGRGQHPAPPLDQHGASPARPGRKPPRSRPDALVARAEEVDCGALGHARGGGVQQHLGLLAGASHPHPRLVEDPRRRPRRALLPEPEVTAPARHREPGVRERPRKLRRRIAQDQRAARVFGVLAYRRRPFVPSSLARGASPRRRSVHQLAPRPRPLGCHARDDVAVHARHSASLQPARRSGPRRASPGSPCTRPRRQRRSPARHHTAPHNSGPNSPATFSASRLGHGRAFHSSASTRRQSVRYRSWSVRSSDAKSGL